jgi:hypothetical protein
MEGEKLSGGDGHSSTWDTERSRSRRRDPPQAGLEQRSLGGTAIHPLGRRNIGHHSEE